MKFNWLLSSLFSVFLLSSTAEAASLKSWNFDTNRNLLNFTTSGKVKPTVELKLNPTRLIINLPETSFSNSIVNQINKPEIKSIQVQQASNNTTIEIELKSGYMIDPQQVQFHNIYPGRWNVELPPLELIKNHSLARQQINNLPDKVILEDIQVISDGLLINTSGGKPEIIVNESPTSNYIYIDIKGCSVSSNFTKLDKLIHQHGIGRIVVNKIDESIPSMRIMLQKINPNINWKISLNEAGGILVSSKNIEQQLPKLAASDYNYKLTTIESIELINDGAEILIKANQPITSYRSKWDMFSGAYQIIIPAAKLGSKITPPRLYSNTSVLWIYSKQKENNQVVIMIKPTANIQLQKPIQLSHKFLSLKLKKLNENFAAPSQTTASTNNSRPLILPRENSPNSNYTPLNQRVVVAIDPGHGGADPGAVGIDGLREKDVVLPISKQVADKLKEKGIEVVFTRSNDLEVDLAPRVDLAERINATLFVSIHANAISMSRPDVNGIETYYYQTGAALATTIHNSLLAATGGPDRQVRSARFYVLRKTSMPAVLVEVGFVTGAEDAPKLANPNYRSLLADAIAEGVFKYIQNNYLNR
ncbi:MAG: N-acetylmuramoyl-L-alanine amidase [Microcoleaceae cyanobacterium MO_207.B10]|nr:N-acetylmuramoyl-L-alanine amidase [Microcoleaceae cyanobacterium MO_207.B10]